MAGLVYRYEIIVAKLCCGRRRSHKKWKYVFYAEEVKQSGDEAIDPWQGRIKGIKREIEKLE